MIEGIEPVWQGIDRITHMSYPEPNLTMFLSPSYWNLESFDRSLALPNKEMATPLGYL